MHKYLIKQQMVGVLVSKWHYTRITRHSFAMH